MVHGTRHIVHIINSKPTYIVSSVILFILHEARRILFCTNLLTKWVNKQVNNNINNDNNNNNFSEDMKTEKKNGKKYNNNKQTNNNNKKSKYNSSISAAWKNVKFVFL